jgi:uroporphyrinogen decarboxylase
LTGYEIVRKNIEFDRPERIALRFPSLGVSDVFRIYLQPPRILRNAGVSLLGMDKKSRPQNGSFDEWGCRWETLPGLVGEDMGQVTFHPLGDWSKFTDYAFPNPYAEGRFDGLEAALAQSGERYVQLNSPFCLFERMHFLRGLSQLMLDLVEKPQELERLANAVIEYQIGIIQQAGRLGKGRIHCFDTTDDWGTQTGMMISPHMWRDIFKPFYRRMVEAAHDQNMHVRFHTDGKVNPILSDLVEMGVDVINIHQPRLLGIEEVGRIYRGRVCFEASIDIQSTLPTGDRKLIDQEARALIEQWASTDGGFIAVEYRDLGAIGADRRSLEWALEAFQKYGQFI